ncbi:MAG: sugar phosphate nucleotidyltransferase, partial [Bacteroidota bacterium]
DVTLATIPVNDRDAPGFGIMKVDEKGFIGSFIEKPKKDILGDWKSPLEEKYTKRGKHYLASMGIYMFSKKVLTKLFKDNKKAIDFGKEIIPDAINGGYKVASYAFDGYWTDIGTIHSFFEANIALTDPVPDFNLFDNEKYVYTRPRLLAPSKVYGTFINRAIVAEGCILHGKKIDRAVVGIRSRIGEGTELTDTIMMGADYYELLEDVEDPLMGAAMGVGKDCFIERAILDKNVRIGNNVVIKGSPTLKDVETDTYMIRDGIIVVKKGAFIEDGARIGNV